MATETTKAPIEGLVGGMTVVELREEMRLAVTEGVQSAMTKDAAEQFWETGLSMFQKYAAQQTGRFVLDGVKAGLKRVFWIAVIVGVLWAVSEKQLAADALRFFGVTR